MQLLNYTIILFFFASSALAETWRCSNGEVIETQKHGNILVINNKYKAFLENERCFDSEGGYDCEIYSNKGYSYAIVWVDDMYILDVTSKWKPRYTCY